MANLMFYQNPVPLSKTEHKDRKIANNSRNFQFAAGTNSVILAGVEFSEAGKEYPIVFAQAGENIIPVALLGLRNEENLYVSEDGDWDARYIPAFVRRYPFVLAEFGDSNQRAVCVDEGFEGWSETDGEPLFEGEEPSPLLKQALDFLEEYQKQYVRTEAFVNRLKENDLLMALNAKIDLVNGQQFAMTGLLAVDERKLLQLPDDKAISLFRSGELSWIYCHLMSLGCMGTMIDRMAKLGLLEAPEGEDAAEEDGDKPKSKARARAKK